MMHCHASVPSLPLPPHSLFSLFYAELTFSKCRCTPEVDNNRDARPEEPPLHREIKEHAVRMRVFVVRYFVGLHEETIAKDVLT